MDCIEAKKSLRLSGDQRGTVSKVARNKINDDVGETAVNAGPLCKMDCEKENALPSRCSMAEDKASMLHSKCAVLKYCHERLGTRQVDSCADNFCPRRFEDDTTRLSTTWWCGLYDKCSAGVVQTQFFDCAGFAAFLYAPRLQLQSMPHIIVPANKLILFT